MARAETIESGSGRSDTREVAVTGVRETGTAIVVRLAEMPEETMMAVDVRIAGTETSSTTGGGHRRAMTVTDVSLIKTGVVTAMICASWNARLSGKAPLHRLVSPRSRRQTSRTPSRSLRGSVG